MPEVTGVPVFSELPTATALRDIFPNPCNPNTTIAFETALPGPVSLKIHNLQGALVQTLITGTMTAGRHRITWNGRDHLGQPVASGIYLVSLTAGEYRGQRKLVMLK
jgi:hypothetical protein